MKCYNLLKLDIVQGTLHENNYNHDNNIPHTFDINVSRFTTHVLIVGMYNKRQTIVSSNVHSISDYSLGDKSWLKINRSDANCFKSHHMYTSR